MRQKAVGFGDGRIVQNFVRNVKGDVVDVAIEVA
jgi:hypothetical protein